MVQLTDTEEQNLGVGFALTSRFDAETSGGSLDLVDGFECLARDFAFATSVALDASRGELPRDEFFEEVRVTVRDIVDRDSRVEAIVGDITVESAETPGELVVELTVDAITDERGDLVVPVRP